MSRIRGVNLGEWLVLERWMDTSVFRGTDARDEDNLCRQLDDGAKAERFKEHRDGFIEEKDFEFIRRCGLEVVLVPWGRFRILHSIRWLLRVCGQMLRLGAEVRSKRRPRHAYSPGLTERL